MPKLYEEPGLTVRSIALKDGNSFSPEFDIVLRITNPNRFDLNLVGMSYTLELEGNEVLSGVSNDLPVVAAYGEADIGLTASVNLIGSLNLFRDLMQRNRNGIDYVLDTRLDPGLSYPTINIRKTGQLPIQ